MNRVLQNLGGIANMTVIPAGGGVDRVMAFDTGPGNMVIDACMAALFREAFDRDGRWRGAGRVLTRWSTRVMRELLLCPAAEVVRARGVRRGVCSALMAMCRKAGGDGGCVATATGLTAASVLEAYRRILLAHLAQQGQHGAEPPSSCVAGGGAKNRTLMAMLREGFADWACGCADWSELGIPAQAKEAMAFALLAWLTWHGLPGNVPAATGASRPVVAGKGLARMRRPADSSGRCHQPRFCCSATLAGCHCRAAATPARWSSSWRAAPTTSIRARGRTRSRSAWAALIFDALVRKDEHYNLVPWLATSWEQPDALTWVFHLRDGVRFQDGRPLEAADVVWTIESLIDPKLAGLITAKSGSLCRRWTAWRRATG